MNNLKLKKVQIDAIINELFDQGYTPHVVVHTSSDSHVGPTHLANAEGFTIFNLSISAVRNYDVDDAGISFDATFGGKGYFCYLKWENIGGIFAKEEPGMFIPFPVEMPVEEPEVHLPGDWDADEQTDNVINLCPDAEPWRNPNANAKWALAAKLV